MSSPLQGLRALTAPRARPITAAGQPAARTDPDERCEMCREVIAAEHGHVADLQAHRLLCTCRACYLLFTGEGAGGKRFRAVPTRVVRLADFTMTPAQWDSLQIPVDLAFFFQQSGDVEQSADTRQVACYPGPGGATESLLDLTCWDDVLTENPALRDVEPDVEAILLRRDGPEVECFITPIDACYELVGLVRRHWVGFAGGEDVWRRIDTYFEGLRRRAAPPGHSPTTGRTVPRDSGGQVT